MRAQLIREFGSAYGERRNRIALIGLRGAGKSTLGAQLARRLGSAFVELDHEIEAEAGTSLHEIFLLHGQQGFRRYERRALERTLEKHERCVIATGGSLVSEPGTYDLLLSTCFTVWLKAAPEEHMARVVAQGDYRPMAGNREAMDDLRRILDGRAPLYAQADRHRRHRGTNRRREPRRARARGCRAPLIPPPGGYHERRIAVRRRAAHRRHLRPHPRRATCTGGSRSPAPSRPSRWTSTRRRASSPATSSSSTRTTSASTSSSHDALQRIRFEHPEVKVVVITSATRAHVLLGRQHLHARAVDPRWKVNFCKFTNETRNGIEDSSRTTASSSSPRCNGTVAGGGYELALACDEILMIDDRSSAVSLPEVPLLGVLPGTGGLTRVTDKRKVRRDLADVFCTTSEGVRARPREAVEAGRRHRQAAGLRRRR